MSSVCKSRPDRTADVLMTLHESDWLSPGEIADEIDAIPGTVRTVTQKLEENGQIESKPDTRFPVRKVYRVR